MLNYSLFINKEVTNANNESGVVTSFDKDNIVVTYPSGNKTYKQALAFKNNFLKFKDENLNSLINEDQSNLQIEIKRKEESLIKAQDDYKNRAKVINRRYKELKGKQYMLRQLFGGDFVYPPYKEFKKKYNHIIVDEDKMFFKRIFCRCCWRPGHHYWYWYI